MNICGLEYHSAISKLSRRMSNSTQDVHTSGTTEQAILEENDTHIPMSIITTSSVIYMKVIPSTTGYILIYGQSAVWLIGTLGNTLSFLVFSRKSMNNSSSSFLFRWLAVFDFLAAQKLLERFAVAIRLPQWIKTTFMCRITLWIPMSSEMVSVWILMAISIERLIGVMWPHQAKTLCTLRRSKMILLTIIIFGCATRAPFVLSLGSTLFYETTLGSSYYYCVIQKEANRHLLKVAHWLQFIFYSAAPFIILLTTNMCIITKLIKHKRQSEQTFGSTTLSGLSGMTFMLISVSITFFDL